MIKLSRKKENRERLLRNLATSLILHESITTTDVKAKSVLPYISKLIGYSQANTLFSRRSSKKILFHQGAVDKLFEDIRIRLLKANPQENIQVIKLPNRQGDNAPQTKIRLSLKSLEETIKNEEKTKK